MSKFQSRTTKIALASVLATSAIVPAVAASAAETTPSRSMPDGKYTIDFTITDTTKQLAKYVKGPATLVIEDGKYAIQLSADETVMNMLTKVEVNGANVVQEVNGQKVIYIPVERPGGTVKGEGTVKVGDKEIPTSFELTLDPTTIKAPEAKPEEKVEFKPGKTFKQVKDGEYAITFDAYHPETNKGEYTAITSHIEKDAKLIVKDGKYSVQLAITEKSNPMITGLKVGGVDAKVVSGSVEKGPQVFNFPITSISDLVKAEIHVVVPAANMDKWYPFGFAINTTNLDLPEVTAEEPVEAGEELPLYIYKDKTNEVSVMSNYVKPTVTVTETEESFLVDLTFVQGQYLNKFDIKGATIANEKTVEAGKNTTKIYTVETTNLDAIYTATVDVSVDAGPVKYDSTYPVQLQFGGKQNPFKDITKLGDYGNIVTLYSLDIFKKADKFNPNGKVKRSQFALMLNRYLGLDASAKTTFKDITKFDAETQNAIKALSESGIMNGTSATAFEPTKEVTRQQAAVIIYRVLEGAGYKATGAKVPFKDVTTSNKEVVTAIAELNALGIMTGNEGKFNPNNTLTRSQMAKVILNTLYVLEY
ncbi:NEAT domain-containing protein [Bacillus ndiopicus]|uniref:NEAT domain-containing protein n=1 Tax=Bacillus ndiopicus TaxID=1347368 RepID=UPI0005A5D6A9|nr:NEAT domain-containing protein [Bacillus ndiopicus]